MTCQEFLSRLSELPRPDAVQEAHARSCPACAALLEDWAAVSPPATLAARIAQQMDLTPVRPLASDRVLTLRLLTVLCASVLGGSLIVGVHAHHGAGQVTWLLLYGCLVIASIGFCVDLPSRLVPGSSVSRVRWVSLAALAMFAVAVAARFGRVDLADPVGAGAACLRLGALWGGIAAAGVWFVLRRGLWLGAGSGAFAALAAAMAGLAGLTLHCPILDVAHVLIWHGAAIVFLSASGASLMFLRNFQGR